MPTQRSEAPPPASAPEHDWSKPPTDAPPGGGPGWEPLSAIADWARYMLSCDMDEDTLEWFAGLTEPEQTKVLYTQSDCDDFAIALHRITGWPLIAVRFPDEDVGVGHHTLAQAPDGRLLDAEGWQDRARLKRKLGGAAASYSEPGGEDVASYPDIGENFSEHGGIEYDEVLARAVSAIRQLPWPPFNEQWFREMSLRPVPGVDIPERNEAGPRP